MTPANAKKETSQADVKANLELKASSNRKYPPLSIGEKVRILRKRAPGDKERESRWSIEQYSLSEISEAFGQKSYKVGGMTRDYTRGELLSV